MLMTQKQDCFAIGLLLLALEATTADTLRIDKALYAFCKYGLNRCR